MTARKKKTAKRRATAKKKKPSRRGAAGKRSASKRRPTCFVVIGFGRKTDYATGRVLDLDKTYEQLIRPAFDRVGVNAFRAIDANLTGSIDKLMYRWIYDADIVVADLSTLNANVFYELGVRHAQKPNTTIIIAESVLMSKIPFDLSSFVVHEYHHGGDEITQEEQDRFVEHLAETYRKIEHSVEEARKRDARIDSDSPVFTFLNGMSEPEWEADTFLAPPAYVPPDERAEEKSAEEAATSLSHIIDAAEAAKNRKDFPKAIELFEKAIAEEQKAAREVAKRTGVSDQKFEEEWKPDLFLAQRLALVTYKNGETRDEEGNVDKERAIEALREAERILERYCAPTISTDPETLGLSGAINKRLHDHTGQIGYLDRAIFFYERGFYVKQDYYNGINVAFMYTIRSLLLEDRFEAIVSYGHANIIRQRVGDVCERIVAGEDFDQRGDKEWVLTTLGEVYHGLGETEKEEMLAPRIEAEASDFAKHTYGEQKKKLADAMAEFDARVHPEVLTGEGKTSTADKTVITRAARDLPVEKGAIVIDADLDDRPIKSVEVKCKIKYD